MQRREFLFVVGGTLLSRSLRAQQASEEEPRITAPLVETPEALERIAHLRKRLQAAELDASAVLKDPAQLDLHELTAFRELVRDHAPSQRLTMVTPEEPGTPLVAVGELRDATGAPAKDALVYVYQTSTKGWYSERAPHLSGDGGDQGHARLFGYVVADERGRFEVRTIRPAGYPGTDLPAHIHVQVFRDERRLLVSEFLFEDDPRLTPAQRDSSRQAGFPICPVTKDADGVQHVAASFTLRG